MELYLLILIFLPISLLIGIAAGTIGYTAWSLIVPILFVLLGFDLRFSLFVTLFVDFINAIIISFILKKKNEIDSKLGIRLSILGVITTLVGVIIGINILMQNQGFFKGSAGYINIILGIIFINKGIKMFKNSNLKFKEKSLISDPKKADIILYIGSLANAFLTGLIGIGGGMNYVLLFMICRGFQTKKATGTAMIITSFSTFIAGFIYFIIILKEGLLVSSNISFALIIVGMSAIGTILGAKLSLTLSEAKINILIGSIVVIAALIATIQSFLIK